MQSLDTLRLSRFDVIFISLNQHGKSVKCHFHTTALNELDAAFIFGQNNQGKYYVVFEVVPVN
ncbi:TPA: hypothetical protein QH064_005061 [Klebsiella pneumoniae subsp. pneumoniae]|nr:hypothetical protein [Klebsiella pneumoniae subsp. pneumoniae]